MLVIDWLLRFNIIPLEILCFVDIGKLNLKCICQGKAIRIDKRYCKKEEEYQT